MAKQYPSNSLNLHCRVKISQRYVKANDENEERAGWSRVAPTGRAWLDDPKAYPSHRLPSVPPFEVFVESDRNRGR
jgi:hypothetical protein